MSDNTAAVYLEGGNFGDILRAGSGADTLKGGGGNDVLEGGVGADRIEGGSGIDTASYEHAGGGVYVRLDSMVGYGGEAQDDELFDIENLAGSAFADSLIGDDNNNTLRGNGGLDDIAGRDGDDRIVVSSTPGSVGGDGGEDVLIVMGGGTVSLGWMNFDGIEAVYVRNDTHLHMTDVQVGSRIVSQSTSGRAVEIVGTSGNDTIKSGKGWDTIDGGTGSDRLFAGTGADSFRFEAGFGRDNLYGLDLNADHILIDVAGVGDIVLRSLNNGRHTLVTFEGVEAGNKIILHDMNVDDVRDAQNELFLFGA
ncbi:calcium-binding protein [Methylobacterium sp. 77]|uniref:calcium-binding protein n=1 Tax=Methylobacterium sp. 77 TaxID=1101192 RepID=UPI0003642565|nr:calcium-binding protein [Methylobacterium sp. 77]